MDKVETWDNWNQKGGPRYPHGKVIQFLFRHYPSRPDREQIDVLDLGCGSGANMLFLAQEGFRAHGRDISSCGIRNTREKMTASGLTAASLEVADVGDLDCPDSSFDALICIGVLECVGTEKLGSAFSEISRILRPGGIALLVFASDADFRCSSTNSLQLHGFTDAEVEAAVSPVRHSFEKICFDRYITTYDNQRTQQNEHLISLKKSSERPYPSAISPKSGI